MTKGLKSTLLTVAVALLGFNAMATAPTIGNIPDVIIGDAENGSASNIFVYPDALSLDTLVTDDATSDAAIIWSFRSAGSNYTINGKAASTGDLINPPAGDRLNTNTDTYTPQDADPRTITFRNVLRTPGPGNANGVGEPDSTSDSQVLTLVASDGSTASQKSFMVYSDNDSPDATSGTQAIEDLNLDFSGNTNGWVSITTVGPFGGGSLTFANNSTGLCVTVSGPGIQFGVWSSDPNGGNFDSVSLVANAVYELRTQISASGQTFGNIPAIQVVFENTLTWYGATYLLLDLGNSANRPSQWGANSVTPGPLSTYTNFYTPAAYRNAEFQTAVSAPANAATKDFRIQLGVLDSDGGGGAGDTYGGGADAGTVCFQNVIINRYDAAAMSVLSTPYDNASPVTGTPNTTGTNTTPGIVNVNNFSRAGATNVSVSGGAITITPTSATAWNPVDANEATQAFVSVAVGDGAVTIAQAGDPTAVDDFPLPWVTGRLYRMTYWLAAPDAAGENSPPDFFYVAGLVLSNELINTSYMTTKFGNAGMPNQGAAQPYSVFFHCNNETFEPGSWKGIATNFQTGAVASFIDNLSGGNQNTGGIVIDRIQVEEVSF